MQKLEKKNVDKLYSEVRDILSEARNNAITAVNFTMVLAYWNIGKIIVEHEQKGKKRAEYGQFLIKELSKRLTEEFGKGFTLTNLKYRRQFYLKFQKSHALRDQLSWTHYRLLLRIENDNSRDFYLSECVENGWSTRELERQINSLFYERTSLSKVKKVSKKGKITYSPEDIIRDPYVLEFLNIKEHYSENDLESLLVEKLKYFLLELGKGFSFVARQKRISLDGDHFYVDMVFYNYILKCFVLIDLKIGKLSHKDIGQMDFYVRYFEKEIRKEGDNPTIGLILCSDKNEAMVKYTLLNDNIKKVFASKYKLYLPSEEELRKEIKKERSFIEIEQKLEK